MEYQWQTHNTLDYTDKTKMSQREDKNVPTQELGQKCPDVRTKMSQKSSKLARFKAFLYINSIYILNNIYNNNYILY